MTNLEFMKHIGRVKENWFIDDGGKDAVKIVVFLADEEAEDYKHNRNWLLEEFKESCSSQKPEKFGASEAMCPNCKELFILDEDWQYNYCPYCGQKLDWSDENEC